ncbi:MAG: sulfatase [Dysgonamonadaceae bacterium]|jgi:arylsulfatase A
MGQTKALFFTVGFFVGFSNLADAQFAETPPNIVFILTDDLGWTDLRCYGNKFNETPHIDKLAERGIRFTQAYAACPVCSPTRASILTGKYPARLHLTNFLIGNRTDPESPVLPPSGWKTMLDAREVTLPELLKTKGYTSAMVGKWHLGNHDSVTPWNQGFDFTRMIGKNGLDYYNYSIFIDSYQNEFIDDGTNYLTDKLTEYGVEFIRKNKDQPFFLYMAYSAPHVFIVPRGDKMRKYFFKYEQSKPEKFNPYYAAMVESIDDGVGRIMKTLEENGLLENTLVIFTSDNGGLGIDELGPTPTNLAPLRKWKGHIYEGGIRVPAIFSWPGKLQAGKVSENYFSSIDYLPTFCELTGISEIPENVDGKSIVPLLLKPEKKQDYERPLFWHYPHFSNQLGRPAGSVRMGDFKLVELYETGTLELYNLKEDISESNNLSEKMKDKTTEMYKLLADWRKSVNAQMPVPNPDYQPPSN